MPRQKMIFNGILICEQNGIREEITYDFIGAKPKHRRSGGKIDDEKAIPEHVQVYTFKNSDKCINNQVEIIGKEFTNSDQETNYYGILDSQMRLFPV